MPISDAHRKAIATPVVEAKYAPLIEAAQETLDQTALDFNREQIGPEVLAWLQDRPQGADKLLRIQEALTFTPPGRNQYLRARAPRGTCFYVVDGRDSYGGWSGHEWPALHPVGAACEKLLAVRAERDEALASLVAALKAFASVARLETEWPEIWPSVPEKLKASGGQGRALQVDVQGLNAKFGLPVPQAKQEAA